MGQRIRFVAALAFTVVLAVVVPLASMNAGGSSNSSASQVEVPSERLDDFVGSVKRDSHGQLVVRGKLEVLHAGTDRVSRASNPVGSVKPTYLVRVSMTKSYRLETGSSTSVVKKNRRGFKMPSTLKPNQIVAVNGASGGDGSLDADSIQILGMGTAGDLEPRSGPGAYTSLPVRKLAVIFVNFTDHRTTTWNAAQMRDALFLNNKSVRNYYLASSSGDVRFEGALDPEQGDYFGYYELPIAAEDPDPDECTGNSKLHVWADAANAAAIADGKDLESYDHIMYVVPSWCGSAAGWGTVGGSRTWIPMNTAAPQRAVLGHELGHNMGMGHSDMALCAEHEQPVPISRACRYSGYADPFDVMTSGRENLLTGFHRTRLGFLPLDNTVDIDPTQEGDHTLYPTEQRMALGTAQVLRVHRNVAASEGETRNFFYLDYRQPFAPFDDFTPGDPIVRGVSIRAARAYDQEESSIQTSEPALVNTSAFSLEFNDTVRSRFLLGYKNEYALTLDRSFYDPIEDFTITTKSVSAERAIVHTNPGPPPGESTSVEVDGPSLRVMAGAGKVNNISVADASGSFVVTDQSARVGAGDGCSQLNAIQVSCNSSGIDEIEIQLGDKDDLATITGDTPATINGGSGNDGFQGGSGGDTFVGGTGSDAFLGNGGSDTVSYADHSSAVTVTQDNPNSNPNDGSIGEGDSVGMDIEQIVGGAGDDHLLMGSDAAESSAPNNTLEGGPGNDELRGGVGADTIVGGPGTDTITGGVGADIVDSRDGATDASIDCGADLDTAQRDAFDPSGIGCETTGSDPRVEITGGPSDGSSIGSSQVSFAFDSFNSPFGTQCRIATVAVEPPPGLASCTSPFSNTTSLSDVSYEFEVRVVDSVGNQVGSTERRRFSVDTERPFAYIDDAPPARTASQSATVEFHANELGASFECSIDGAPFVPCNFPFTATGLEDGTHGVEIAAIDRAGNRSLNDADASWVVDTTPPDTQIDSAPSALTNDDTAEFSFSGVPTSDTSSTECRIWEIGGSEPEFADCTGAGNFVSSPLPDGEYAFEVRAIDDLGNIDPTPAHNEFELSQSAGTVRIDTTASPMRLVVVGGPGKRDTINVVQSSNLFTITDTTAPIAAADSACIQSDPHMVECLATTVSALTVDAGTFDDFVSASSTLLSSVTLFGGTGNDVLTGASTPDTIDGGFGDDMIDGGLGTDQIVGGDGIDTADYSGRTEKVVVSLDGLPNDGDFAVGEQDNVDTENVRAGSGPDVLDGSIAANRISGGAGVDTLNGLDGDDTLDGGTEADVFNGGNGTDTVDYSSRILPVTVTIGFGNYDGQSGELDDVRTGIENVVGGSGDDWLDGDQHANKLEGRDGSDGIRGFGGNDVILAGDGGDRSQDGGDGDDYIATGPGNDQQADGGAGADDLSGGDGYDQVIMCCDSNDRRITMDDQPNDGINDGAEGDNVHSDYEVVSSGNGDDVIIGSPRSESVFAGEGNDVIDGAGDSDYLGGGPGIDTVDYSSRSRALNLLVGLGSNSGEFGEYDTIGNDVERAIGGTGNDLISDVWSGWRYATTANDNEFIGGPGNDKLLGNDGDDVLQGGSGSDTINAGAGIDNLIGDTGADSLFSRDASVDSVSCGDDTDVDVISSDPLDSLLANCSDAVQADAPNTSISNDVPSNGVSPLSTVIFEFSSDIPDTAFECSTDSGSWEACETPYEATFTDGGHSLNVRASDYGISDATPAESLFTIDTNSPAIELTQIPPSLTNDTTPTAAFNATDPAPSSGVTSVTCQVDNGSQVACSDSFTASALADGPHTITVRATDAAGNATTAQTAFTVDATGTNVEIASPSAGASLSAASVDVVFTDDGTAISTQCTVDGASPAPCTSSLAVTGDGTHTVVVNELDAAGNASSDSVSFTIDSVSPVIQLTQTPPSLTNATPTAAFNATDPAPSSGVTSVTCQVDNGSQVACSDSFTASALADGPHTITVRATDAAGNATTAQTAFTVDATGTNVEIASPSAGASLSAASVDVVFTDDGTAISTQCTVDGASPAPCTSSLAVTGDGTHTVVVNELDAAGNASSDSVSFTIDSVSPVIQLTQTPPSLTNATPTAAFNATDPAPSSGVTSVTCQVDNGSQVACSDSFTASALADGPHTITVRATDAAGNATTAQTAFTVDATPPEVSFTAPSGFVPSSTPLLQFSASDASGILTTECSIDETPAFSCESGQALPSLSDGSHSIAVIATDTVENSTSVSSDFVVDAVADVDLTPGATSTLTVNTDVNELNTVQISHSGSDYIVTDAGAPLNSSTVCTQSTANTVTCPDTAVTAVRVDSGNQDDSVTVNSSVAVPATLIGGTGVDGLQGGPGDDILIGGLGNDALTGSGGIDTVDYSGATASVNIKLHSPVPQVAGGDGSDVISGVENATGSAFNDSLIGNSGDNLLIGNGGNDTLDGYSISGVDTVSYATAPSGVTVNLAASSQQNTNGAGVDTLKLIDNVIGSAFNDTLTGSTSANYIEGGEGDDVLNPALGIDTIGYVTALSGVDVNLTLTSQQNTGGAGSDTISNTERLTGSSFNDHLIGSVFANFIAGGPGDDFIEGHLGVDNLNGGSGDDTFEARDTVVDTITCDGELGDTASLDRRDTATGCAQATVESVAVYNGTFVIYIAASGQLNNVTASYPGGSLLIEDASAGIYASYGCESLSTHLVSCVGNATTGVGIDLGDLNDVATVDQSVGGNAGLTGSDGDDILTNHGTGPSGALSGGTGDDQLQSTNGHVDNNDCGVGAQDVVRMDDVDTDVSCEELHSGPDIASLIGPGEGAVTADTSPEFSFTADSTGISFICQVDGGEGYVCDSPDETASLPDGPHTFTVSAVDGYGNIGNEASQSFMVKAVDFVAPNVQITDAPEGVTNDNAPIVSFTVEDPAPSAGMLDTTCEVDSTGPIACQDTFEIPYLEDGTHTFTVRASDLVNNVATAQATFTIDTGAPELTITAPANGGFVGDTTPTIDFVINDISTTTSTCRVDSQSPVACSVSFTTPALTQGAHSVTIVSTDAAGSSSEQSVSFHVDTMGPGGSPISPTGYTSDATPFFQYTSNDASPIASITCRMVPVNPAGSTIQSSCTNGSELPYLNDGYYAMYVNPIIDAAGNSGSSSLGHFTVDTTAPAITLLAPAANGATADTTPAINYVLSEVNPVSSSTCIVDEGEAAQQVFSCTAGASVPSALTYGTHTIKVTHTDLASNPGSTSHSFTVAEFVDTTPPVVTISSPTNGGYARAVMPSVEFAVTDDTTTSTQCRVDAQSPVSCTSPYVTPTLTQGQHSVTVIATDLGGNSTTVATVFTVDTVLPTAYSNAPSGFVNNSTPLLNLSTSEPVSSVSCRILPTNPSGSVIVVEPCSNGTEFPTLANGSYMLYANPIFDLAGNQGSVLLNTFTVDTVTPTVTIQAPTATAVLTDTTPGVTYTVSDANPSTTSTCVVDEGTASEQSFSCTSGSSAPVALTGRPHSIRVAHSDRAGNAASAIVNFSLDIDPETTITSAPTDPTTPSNVSWAFTSDGQATFECSLDGVAYSSCTSPYAPVNVTDGDHDVAVRAISATGKIDATPAVQIDLTVDSVAPDTAFGSTPADGVMIDEAAAEYTFSSPNDSTATFQCAVDSGAFQSCTSPWNATYLYDGSHTVKVRAVDAAGNADASPATRTITTNLTDRLSTSQSSTPSTMNLTTSGVLDWAHWGAVSETSFNHKAQSTPQISNFSLLGSGTTVTRETNATPLYSWSDGDPTANDSGSMSGVSTGGASGRGFRVTVPASQADGRVLKLYVGAQNTSGMISLSGTGSNTVSLTGGSTLNLKSYSIYFRGNDPTGSVTIDFTQSSSAANGKIYLYAATLENAPTVAPPNGWIVTGPAEGEVTNDNTPTFPFGTDTADPRFYCKVDSGTYSYCSPSGYTTNPLSEGAHTLRVRVSDRYGNVDTSPVIRNFAVDAIP